MNHPTCCPLSITRPFEPISDALLGPYSRHQQTQHVWNQSEQGRLCRYPDAVRSLLKSLGWIQIFAKNCTPDFAGKHMDNLTAFQLLANFTNLMSG